MFVLAHWDGTGPGPWIALAWAVVFLVVVVVLLWRGPGWRAGWRSVGSAESVLAERYARGEIGEEEYRRTLAVLREHRS